MVPYIGISIYLQVIILSKLKLSKFTSVPSLDNKNLMGEKYLICKAEVLSTDLSDTYLTGPRQSIVNWFFRQILDYQLIFQIIPWYTVSKTASYNLYLYGLPRTCSIDTDYNLQIIICIYADNLMCMQIRNCIVTRLNLI